MSLIDKLNSQQMEEIKKKCIIENSGKKFYISSITPLPHDYMISFDYEDGSPASSFCVQFGDKIEVLPPCGFSSRLKEFLEDYLKLNKKNLLL